MSSWTVAPVGFKAPKRRDCTTSDYVVETLSSPIYSSSFTRSGDEGHCVLGIGGSYPVYDTLGTPCEHFVTVEVSRPKNADTASALEAQRKAKGESPPE